MTFVFKFDPNGGSQYRHDTLVCVSIICRNKLYVYYFTITNIHFTDPLKCVQLGKTKFAREKYNLCLQIVHS